MGVGVAVAVQVAALVDGHAADRELDVLPLARVESAQEDLLGVAFAAFVGQEDAGRELEQLGGIGARHLGKLVDPKLEIGRAPAGRRPAAEHGDVEGSGSRRWRCRRFRRGAMRPAKSQVLAWTATPAPAAGTSGRAGLEVEEELDSARHRDAIAQRRPKSPVAGCLDRRMVQTRFHAMGKGHARDVPFGIDFDVHRDVTASATVSGAQGVCGLLLFQHCRRLDARGDGAAASLA